MNSTAVSLGQLPAPPPGRTGWPWTEHASPPEREAAEGSWPKITIVCPSFRQGAFIEETIRSVLLQKYPALEFIVMDGGSKDATLAVLEKYAPWLSYWESQSDRGQSHALNKGYARATGDIFGWINSDDYYLPGAFAAIAQQAGRFPRDALWFGDYHDRLGEEPELHAVHNLPAFAFQVAVGGRILPSHATFWRRTIHQPFNEALQFTMDVDLFKRFARAGIRPRHVKQSLAVFRRHPSAKTSTLADVASREMHAWFATCPWYYPWLHRLSRLLDRIRRLR